MGHETRVHPPASMRRERNPKPVQKRVPMTITTKAEAEELWHNTPERYHGEDIRSLLSFDGTPNYILKEIAKSGDKHIKYLALTHPNYRIIDNALEILCQAAPLAPHDNKDLDSMAGRRISIYHRMQDLAIEYHDLLVETSRGE